MTLSSSLNNFLIKLIIWIYILIILEKFKPKEAFTEITFKKFGEDVNSLGTGLVEKYNLKDIDVLKVGHHGSKTSSSKSFINEIKPKYSIISVGKNNLYGHPNDSVLNNLIDSQIYRTDQDGSIMFKIKNNKLEIETYLS